MRIRREKNFLTCFDEKTGRYIRTGILQDGKDTGVDPFMASYPELLDVGIMGHCRHGKSGLCMAAGVECYQDGLHADAPDMGLEDFRSIAEQCSGQTYQFALGGCGDPDQHGHFREILEICRENNIVPNYTTSGLGLTEELVQLSRDYCGAVAVSWYRSDYTVRAIKMLLKAGIKTNIHYVLNKNTMREAVKRLREHDFPAGINAIIFLLHKPVGLGKRENMIRADDPSWQQLLEYVDQGGYPFKIGFDSCTVPALINRPGSIDPDSLDTCEGARWSAYITADMQMMPCSFDNQERRWAVDLRTHTINEAWDSKQFDAFRDTFRNACPDCGQRHACMGGCPICPEIVLCDSPAKTTGPRPWKAV
jgi:radical SAM protein with 4Fe4S-binding SPASM domain